MCSIRWGLRSALLILKLFDHFVSLSKHRAIMLQFSLAVCFELVRGFGSVSKLPDLNLHISLCAMVLISEKTIPCLLVDALGHVTHLESVVQSWFAYCTQRETDAVVQSEAVVNIHNDEIDQQHSTSASCCCILSCKASTSCWWRPKSSSCLCVKCTPCSTSLLFVCCVFCNCSVQLRNCYAQLFRLVKRDSEKR